MAHGPETVHGPFLFGEAAGELGIGQQAIAVRVTRADVRAYNPAACCLPPLPYCLTTTGDTHMADYVLVHGAWGGNQSYAQTVRDLEAAGHRALACTLRGLGSRQAELHPGITPRRHLDAVCAQVEEAGFDRFILAGHSYGGMVITGVAARLGARIEAIAYIDAFLPGDGESLWDITGEYEHNWYIDTQKHKPGYVDPIGASDFEVVPGVV